MRGDVYELRAPRGARGHEQQGRRYAVIVQADEFAALSTWLVAPTSVSARAATFRPAITIAGQVTRVLVEQTSAIDPSRLGKYVSHLSYEELRTIEAALRLLLNLKGR